MKFCAIYSSLKLEAFTKNPYANEFNENTFADKIKIDHWYQVLNISQKS